MKLQDPVKTSFPKTRHQTVDRSLRRGYNGNKTLKVLLPYIPKYGGLTLMDTTKAKEAEKELTLALLYLSRFAQGEKFSEAKDFYAWKGYNFDILNELDEDDYIRQGNHPTRTKSVYITETGMQKARELLDKYGIEDWK